MYTKNLIKTQKCAENKTHSQPLAQKRQKAGQMAAQSQYGQFKAASPAL